MEEGKQPIPLEFGERPISPGAPDYLTCHGLDALYQVTQIIQLIWSHRPTRPPPDQMIFVSDGRLSIALSDLCFYLGLASGILFDGGKQRPSETAKIHQLRTDRVARVRAACTGIDLSPLADRAARNRLVHMDEYLAKMIVEGRQPRFTNLGLFPQPGSSISADECCRVFLFDSDKLLHLGAEIDVAAVDGAARRVVNRFPTYLAISGDPPLVEHPH